MKYFFLFLILVTGFFLVFPSKTTAIGANTCNIYVEKYDAINDEYYYEATATETCSGQYCIDTCKRLDYNCNLSQDGGGCSTTSYDHFNDDACTDGCASPNTCSSGVCLVPTATPTTAPTATPTTAPISAATPTPTTAPVATPTPTTAPVVATATPTTAPGVPTPTPAPVICSPGTVRYVCTATSC